MLQYGIAVQAISQACRLGVAGSAQCNTVLYSGYGITLHGSPVTSVMAGSVYWGFSFIRYCTIQYTTVQYSSVVWLWKYLAWQPSDVCDGGVGVLGLLLHQILPKVLQVHLARHTVCTTPKHTEKGRTVAARVSGTPFA